MAAKIISGKEVAAQIREELKKEVKELKEKHDVVPGLVTFLTEVESPTLICGILQALGELGDPRAIPATQALANSPDHHVREWSEAVANKLQGNEDVNQPG